MRVDEKNKRAVKSLPPPAATAAAAALAASMRQSSSTRTPARAAAAAGGGAHCRNRRQHHHVFKRRWFVAAVVSCLIQQQAPTAVVQGNWVDPDSPSSSQKTKALTKGDQRIYELVSVIVYYWSALLCAKYLVLRCVILEKKKGGIRLYTKANWGKLGVFFCVCLSKQAHLLSTSYTFQVFSDEFEQDGRTFHDGNDPRWTAIHKNDCA